jgi:Flp pilus assembly protein TadG
MKLTQRQQQRSSWKRSGVVAPFVALLMIPMISMVAFMVDYGYLTVVRSDLQRAADGAALAGVLDLIPNPNGTQNFDTARNTAVRYVNYNLGFEGQVNPADGSMSYGFTVLPADIVTGKYNPETINGSGAIELNTSTGVVHDTMRVTVRRDSSANSPVTLFFAQVIGIASQDVNATATAVLRKPAAIQPGGDVLPFALPLEFWNSLDAGEDLSIYNDNSIEDGYGNQVTVTNPITGAQVPGNWGTVDIGSPSNGTSELSYQIINGLEQWDVDALYAGGRIPNDSEVPLPFYAQADPGLSAGIKSAVAAIHGQIRIIPIYDPLTSDLFSGGNNPEFHIVRWGVIQVLDSHFQGNNNTNIFAQKAYTYDGSLRPRENLSDSSDSGFDNIFTTPVLVR